MTPEILIVAMTIFMEATGEPWAGKVMVAEVIKNRAIASGKSLAEVCQVPKQFSCWNNPKQAEELMADIKSGKTWSHCLALAETIYQPGYQTTTPATHFFNPKLAHPAWAKEMTICAKVGNHVFLRKK